MRYKATGSLTEQLQEFKPKVKDLAAMNKQYGVCAMYHTHSGVCRWGPRSGTCTTCSTTRIPTR